MSLIAALSPLILLAAAPDPAECNPIPGWHRVLADEDIRWIVIGEIHGTEEMPAIFADAVCLTGQARRVVVAVEQPSTDQAAVDAFIASDGGPDAKRAFLSASLWNAPMKDGRSSQAYFNLFETLRQMYSAGKIEAVVAFQPSSFDAPPTPEAYEKAMAEIVKSAASSGTTVIALVGNLHAMLKDVPWEPHYAPMAAHLPADKTLTLNAVGEAGEAWVCTGSEAGDCGVRPQGMASGQSRSVELAADGDGYHSGTIYLGVPTTASPPQPPASGT